MEIVTASAVARTVDSHVAEEAICRGCVPNAWSRNYWLHSVRIFLTSVAGQLAWEIALPDYQPNWARETCQSARISFVATNSARQRTPVLEPLGGCRNERAFYKNRKSLASTVVDRMAVSRILSSPTVMRVSPPCAATTTSVKVIPSSRISRMS